MERTDRFGVNHIDEAESCARRRSGPEEASLGRRDRDEHGPLPLLLPGLVGPDGSSTASDRRPEVLLVDATEGMLNGYPET